MWLTLGQDGGGGCRGVGEALCLRRAEGFACPRAGAPSPEGEKRMRSGGLLGRLPTLPLLHPWTQLSASSPCSGLLLLPQRGFWVIRPANRGQLPLSYWCSSQRAHRDMHIPHIRRHAQAHVQACKQTHTSVSAYTQAPPQNILAHKQESLCTHANAYGQTCAFTHRRLQEHRCPHACTHRALPQAPHAGGCAGRVDGLCHTQLSAAGLSAGISAARANPALTSHSSTVGLWGG